MHFPFHTILGAAAPVFLLLALGFVLRRTRVLTAEADASLMRLVVMVLYPCLFLDFIIGNPALRAAHNLVAAPLAGFLATAGGFVAAYGVARLIGLRRGTGLRTFAFCNGVFNYGYIPIPLITALFASRETLGVLLVFNVGVEAAIWTAGILLLCGRLHRSALRRLLNPPLLALAVALAVNAAGLDARLPGWLGELIRMLGACSIPLGILLAGAAVADLMGARDWLADIRVPAGSIAVRLILLPAAFVAAAALAPGVSTELRQVLVVQAAMPAGIFPIVLARHYGGDAAAAVRIVLATTLASVVTMPLWIRWGSALAF